MVLLILYTKNKKCNQCWTIIIDIKNYEICVCKYIKKKHFLDLHICTCLNDYSTER